MARKDNARNLPSGSFEHNKANDVQRSDDKVGNIYIGLYHIDNAIKYYFDNVIQPTVQLNEETINVPVIYGSPERWKAAQRDGYFRDESGRVQTPLIMYRRTNIEKRRDMGRNLDANNPHIFRTIEKRYTQRNAYDAFSILTNAKPQVEYYNVVEPDHVKITYECTIWTDYVEHMNKLVESINYAEGCYWGDTQTFKFLTEIDSFSQAYSVESGQDRLIKSDFQMTVTGYIVPENIQKKLSQSSEKAFSISRIKVDFNVVDNLVATKDLTARDVFGSDILSKSSVTTGLDMSTIAYLNKMRDSVATKSLMTSTTATFENINIAQPPAASGLPATDTSQFHFFANGNYIEPTAIVSFVQSGADCILTVDTSILEYELDTTMTVAVFGKFD